MQLLTGPPGGPRTLAASAACARKPQQVAQTVAKHATQPELQESRVGRVRRSFDEWPW